MKKNLVVILVWIMALSCSEKGTNMEEEGQADSLSTNTSTSEVAEWNDYLQASDDGLWEDLENHTQYYRFKGYLTDPEALDPFVYNPYEICSFGDTVFVTDYSTQEVVALDSSGNLLWKAGGEGEGPGEFSRVSSLAVSSEFIAASNYYLNRIEFFHRDGSFAYSLSFNGAQGMAALDDSTFIVTSTEEHGGDIHLVNPETGILESFGEVETSDYNEIPRMDMIRVCTNGENRLALFNRYEGLIAVYDLETKESVFRGSRDYPATPTPPQSFVDSHGNNTRLFLPIGGNAFMGHDGMLNVVLTGFMEDGSFLSDPENIDFAQFASVDRYDWEGNYLDSYCLPDSCISNITTLPGEKLVAKDFSEGVLRIYEKQ